MSRTAHRVRSQKTLDGLPAPSDRAGRVRYVWNRMQAEATLVTSAQESSGEELFLGSAAESATTPDASTNIGKRASVALQRFMNYHVLAAGDLLGAVARRIAGLVAGAAPPSTTRSPSASGARPPNMELDHDELVAYFRYYNNWRIDPDADAEEQLTAARQQQQKRLEPDHEMGALFVSQRTLLCASLEASTLEQLFAEDVLAAYDRDPATLRLLEPVLYGKGFQALQLHRLAERLWHAGEIDYALLLQSVASRVLGVDIHPAAHFGQAIMLDHGTGVVVGETARVGDGVSLLHNVTLGGTGKAMADRHPKVGDGVVIGAGAIVLGNIVIGAGATIAAGAIVVKSVAPFVTVIGVAAKEREPAGDASSRVSTVVGAVSGSVSPAGSACGGSASRPVSPQIARVSAPRATTGQVTAGADASSASSSSWSGMHDI